MWRARACPTVRPLATAMAGVLAAVRGGKRLRQCRALHGRAAAVDGLCGASRRGAPAVEELGRPGERPDRARVPGSHAARALRGVPWTLLAYALSRGMTLLGHARARAAPRPGGLRRGRDRHGRDLRAQHPQRGRLRRARSSCARTWTTRCSGTILVCMMGTAVVAAGLCAAASPLLADFFGAPRLVDVMPLPCADGHPEHARLLLHRGAPARDALRSALLGTARDGGRSTWGWPSPPPCSERESGAWWRASRWARSRSRSCCGGSAPAARDHISRSPRLRELSPRAGLRRRDPHRVRREQRPLRGGRRAYSGHSAMGLYSMAYRFTELPALGLARPIAEATFPAVARMRSEREQRGAMLVTSLTYLCLIGLPVPGRRGRPRARACARRCSARSGCDMTPPLQMLCAWGVAAMLAAALRLFVGGTGNPGWVAQDRARAAPGHHARCSSPPPMPSSRWWSSP